MSSRKLSSFTKPRPTSILISFRSAVPTTPSAFTSPVRKVMVAEASTEPEAPFTPGTVTVISEPSQLTCPSSTVTVEPLIVVLLTLPQVVVAVPETLVTASEKVNTMVCRKVPPFPTRHSTPGVPLSGKSIANMPALPCFLREAALVRMRLVTIPLASGKTQTSFNKEQQPGELSPANMLSRLVETEYV